MKLYFLIAVVCGFASSVPAEQNLRPKPNGDMLLTSEQKRALFGKSNNKLRNGVRNPSLLWPNATVFFYMSPEISE